jgi:hypothetical protein
MSKHYNSVQLEFPAGTRRLKKQRRLSVSLRLATLPVSGVTKRVAHVADVTHDFYDLGRHDPILSTCEEVVTTVPLKSLDLSKRLFQDEDLIDLVDNGGTVGQVRDRIAYLTTK